MSFRPVLCKKSNESISGPSKYTLPSSCGCPVTLLKRFSQNILCIEPFVKRSPVKFDPDYYPYILHVPVSPHSLLQKTCDQKIPMDSSEHLNHRRILEDLDCNYDVDFGGRIYCLLPDLFRCNVLLEDAKR